MIGLAVIALLDVLIGAKLPTGFIPQEDQGYLYCALQLPDASSLQRTDDAAQHITKALLDTPGIQGVVAVNGFSLLTLTQQTNTAFFFVTLKPWDQRTSHDQQLAAIQTSVQKKLMGVSQGLAFNFAARHPRYWNLRRRHHDLLKTAPATTTPRSSRKTSTPSSALPPNAKRSPPPFRPTFRRCPSSMQM